MHPTRTFYRAVYSLKAELKSEADPVLEALVDAYTQLKNDPQTVAARDERQGSEDSFVHVFYPGYVLVYRIQADFEGEATLLRQHVYLKNVLRQA
jgi:hypothetical protein